MESVRNFSVSSPKAWIVFGRGGLIQEHFKELTWDEEGCLINKGELLLELDDG